MPVRRSNHLAYCVALISLISFIGVSVSGAADAAPDRRPAPTTPRPVTAVAVASTPHDYNCWTSESSHPADNCLYYPQSYDRPIAGVAISVRDFKSPPTYYIPACNGCAGGQPLWNDEGADANGDSSYAALLWYNANYSGPHVTMAPWLTSGYRKRGSQLGTLLNNDRSQSWSD